MKRHAVRYFNRSFSRLVLGSLVLAVAMLCVKWSQTSAAVASKSWSGGGSTSNWSEAANWSDNIVPGSSDVAIFDGTSTRNATIDVDISIGGIQINEGYIGTITQVGAATLTSPPSTSVIPFIQDDGIFNGGDSPITINCNGFGGFTINGGTFNGGSGSITLTGDASSDHNLKIIGGTFNSTSGTLFLDRGFQQETTGVFNANGGTVTFNGGVNVNIQGTAPSATFNNLNFSKNDGVTVGTKNLIVNGTLALNDGFIDGGSTIEARAGFTISPAFDGGNESIAFAHGSGPRVFTFDTSLKLLRTIVNDPNVTINTSGNGTLNFTKGLELQQGIFNQGSVDVVFSPAGGGHTPYVQTGGIFNGSSNAITANSDGFGAITINGGTFNGGSGNIALTGDANSDHDLKILDGAFNSTSGTLFLDRGFQQETAGVFNPNGGTVTFNGGVSANIQGTAPNATFNNLNFSKADGFAIGTKNLIVTGALALNDGLINGGTIEARGGVTISPAFDGGNAVLSYANGTGTRTFTFDTSLKLLGIVENDPNVTINTSGAGTLVFPHGLVLQQGQFDQGNVDLSFFPAGGGNIPYVQNGGTFNGSAKSITLNGNGFGDLTLTGGAFNGGSGDIIGTSAPNQFDNFSLQGGTFTATSGTLTVPDSFNIQGGSFVNNSGTVVFGGGENTGVVSSTSDVFDNVVINKANANLLVSGRLIVAGSLALDNGSIGQAGSTVEAQGPVVIGPDFDGGSTNLVFSGAANQTFSNNGGVSPTGNWTIDKPSGTVTAATDIILGTSQALNITSGGLFLANGSDLTTGALTIGASGKLINDSATAVTLGGNFTNNGIIDLQGNGAACPENDSIFLRSSVPGVRRNWAGAGVFRLVDVDVQDQGGTAAVTVFSGTNSGNNGANFTFSGSCPTDLALSPQSTSAITGVNVSFTASGGFGTRTFSIPVNNSGATINSSNGVYKAGNTPDVADTVRVTDSFGNTADATVNVTGPASKLAFTVQPSNATAGQSIAPAIVVTVEDASGTAIANATNLVTLSFLSNAGGGTLSGTLFHSAVGGGATFDNVSINRSGAGYTLKATASGLTQANSGTFDIAAATPARLTFSVQPSDASINSAVNPPIQVSIQDSLGNLVADATNPVTLAIGTNSGGSTLSGTLTQPAVNGVASFADITLGKPGNGYTLTASATSLIGATSASFNVTSPFIVTNTNDSGAGSLRDAINNANATLGTQTVTFNIPGSASFHIALATRLPATTDPIVIDGTTQPGYSGSPLIEIDGSSLSGAANGLEIDGGSSTIKGLSIIHFSNSNFSEGILVSTLGGNKIQSNWVGISASGTVAGNGGGLLVNSASNLIGGPNPGDGNVFSGNTLIGLSLVGVNRNNTIQGNFIGTNAAGTGATPNKVGLTLGSSSNTIKQNVISGNLTDGIQNSGDSNNLIQNNIIGMDATATNAVGNGASGISLVGNNTRITGNQIFGNGQLGIKLGNRVTTAAGPPLPNDPQDTDSGANNQQNYPVITSLNYQPSNIIIGGTLNSTPSSSFTLEFFSSPACDASGNGEGAVFLGAGNTSTGSTGNGSFNVSLPIAVDSSQFITATATDANGNTSEFSQCRGPQLTIQGNVKNTSDQPISGATVKIHNNTTNIDKFLTTNSVGHYILANQSQGQTYSIDATKTNFQVLETTTSTDSSGNIDKEFTMQRITSTISGRVTANGSSLSGVTMTLSGSAGATTITDSSGNYSFPNLVTTGTYTVTPSLTNFAFSPPSSTFSGSIDHTANFTATNLLAALTGRIVFASNGQIKEMNADGSGISTVVAKSGTINFSNPSYSASGAKIAYLKQASAGASDSLIVSNQDGSAPVTLTNLGTPLSSHFLSWSPDGTKIATNKLVNGVNQLISVDTTTGAIAPIVTTGVSNVEPDWSPDGNQLVFTRDDSSTIGDGLAVFKVNKDGTGLTKFTNPTLADFQPKWSPDGTKIAFLRSVSGVPTQLCLINSSSPLSAPQVILTVPINTPFGDVEWAPDGSRLAVTESGNSIQLETVLPDGTVPLVSNSNLGGSTFDWGLSNLLQITQPIFTGRIIINLGGPGASLVPSGSLSTAEVEPISPASAGAAPAGYILGDIAFEITTDTAFTPPVSVCIDLPAEEYPTASSFDASRLLHDENGTLADVTTTHDLATRRICGSVATLGNFVVASQINNALPSIHGLVVDQDGNLLSDFPISLTGDVTQQSTTGLDGSFGFVNLTDGGSYLVTPTRVGYVYSAPFQGYDSLSGEQTVVFIATPANFGISGTVTDGNLVTQDHVTITLSGTAEAEAVTDADGTYSFDNLPANGTYFVTPSLPGTSFSPQQVTIDALQNDLAGADFVGLLPTAAPVSITGRAVRADGRGIGSARLTLLSSGGAVRTALTNAFGYYHFEGIEPGSTYVLSISSKGYRFANATIVVNVNEEVSDADFTALP